MEGARLMCGAAPTFLPATAGRAGARLAYEPVAGACGRRAPDRAGAWCRGGDVGVRASQAPGVTGRRGGTTSTRPDGTAPGARAEAADTNAVSPASGAGADPNHGGLVRPPPDDLPPARVRSGDPGGLWHARGPARFTRGKATLGMTALVSQRSTRQPSRVITRQVTRLPRSADAPADPGRAVAPGQRLNVPAGVNRG